MPPDAQQVFLGGACGRTTWRRLIAIPALQDAGITYYDPQLAFGAWTPVREAEEMRAKAAAQVLLYVINAETRGVATIGEAAYGLGTGRRLALMIADIGEHDPVDGRLLDAGERADLNRGRIFLRTMAREHGVPVFAGVEAAVRYAIETVRAQAAPLTAARLRRILDDIGFRSGTFLLEEIESGFLIQLRCPEIDVRTGSPEIYQGRRWHVDRAATESDVVRTAFKAAVTWQEHEARETFTYRGVPLFGAHCDVEALVRVFSPPSPQQDPQ